MYGALEGNVLCQLTLGNKHMFGLDGVPQDYEQAYGNYDELIKNVLCLFAVYLLQLCSNYLEYSNH